MNELKSRSRIRHSTIDGEYISKDDKRRIHSWNSRTGYAYDYHQDSPVEETLLGKYDFFIPLSTARLIIVASFVLIMLFVAEA